jgi:hypothetical protein
MQFSRVSGRNGVDNFTRQAERKTPIGISRGKWYDNIKIYLKGIDARILI